MSRSIAMKQPIIFVSMNYRREFELYLRQVWVESTLSDITLGLVSGIGFLASKEVVSQSQQT